MTLSGFCDGGGFRGLIRNNTCSPAASSAVPVGRGDGTGIDDGTAGNQEHVSAAGADPAEIDDACIGVARECQRAAALHEGVVADVHCGRDETSAGCHHAGRPHDDALRLDHVQAAHGTEPTSYGGRRATRHPVQRGARAVVKRHAVVLADGEAFSVNHAVRRTRLCDHEAVPLGCYGARAGHVSVALRKDAGCERRMGKGQPGERNSDGEPQASV